MPDVRQTRPMISLRGIGGIDRDAITRAAARAWPRSNHGSRPIPEYVVQQMAADYQRLGSLRRVGELYGGRDMSTIRYILLRHGVALKTRGGANRKPTLRHVRTRNTSTA